MCRVRELAVKRIIVMMVFVAAADGVVRAQTASPSLERGYAAISVDYQASSSSFRGGLSFPSFLETETVTSTYTVASTPGFDIAGGVRIWRHLAVGANATRFAKGTGAAVTATVPHPFFFNKAREVNGEAGGVRHEEIAVHVQAAWIVPIAERWLLTLFGGPSAFNVTQSLVSDIAINESYPYDSATFASATLQKTTKTRIGGHAGADVTLMLSRRIGVGGTLRFSRATFKFGTDHGQTVTVDAGGPQVGAGVRFRF
jgi:hypothetical protein